MSRFEVRFDGAQFDEDGFCTDEGPRGAVLFTVEAAYPGALNHAAIRRQIEASGVALHSGFARLPGASVAFNTTDGAQIGVTDGAQIGVVRS